MNSRIRKKFRIKRITIMTLLFLKIIHIESKITIKTKNLELFHQQIFLIIIIDIKKCLIYIDKKLINNLFIILQFKIIFFFFYNDISSFSIVFY